MASKIERFIDAHHHLWDLTECRHTWLLQPGRRFFGDPAPIAKNYHVPEFRDDVGDLPLVGSVHIQVGVEEDHSVGETEWLASQNEQYGLPSAIVAFCDLTKENAQSELDRHQAFATLKGVRQIVGRDAKEDARNGTNALLENPDFKTGLSSLIKRGLSFDLQLTPPLLSAAAELFAQVEDLPVALCHAGSLQDFSEDGVSAWEAGLKRFADVPNAICKLSGFGMFDHDWSATSIRDYVLRAIDIFGPERVAIGSNFPVDKLTASYAKTIGAYIGITDGFSATERDAMFYATAKAFYRL
ncbi:MAG: amidohydrolase family protein [Pseudomonadota bacterium]